MIGLQLLSLLLLSTGIHGQLGIPFCMNTLCMQGYTKEYICTAIQLHSWVKILRTALMENTWSFLRAALLLQKVSSFIIG